MWKRNFPQQNKGSMGYVRETPQIKNKSSMGCVQAVEEKLPTEK